MAGSSGTTLQLMTNNLLRSVESFFYEFLWLCHFILAPKGNGSHWHKLGVLVVLENVFLLEVNGRFWPKIWIKEKRKSHCKHLMLAATVTQIRKDETTQEAQKHSMMLQNSRNQCLIHVKCITLSWPHIVTSSFNICLIQKYRFWLLKGL